MINDHEGILQRLEKLERQNRRMKLAGLGAIVIAGAFFLMGQASGPRTQDEVRARSFVVVDAQGKPRATLNMYIGQPRLALTDANGITRASVAVSSRGPAVLLADANKKAVALLSVQLNGPRLDLVGVDETQGASFEVSGQGPGLQLNDANGFETDIGVIGLTNPLIGETRTTSAASILLFGKDKKVLWSAPPQN